MITTAVIVTVILVIIIIVVVITAVVVVIGEGEREHKKLWNFNKLIYSASVSDTLNYSTI